jgi:2'-5' RNA ligase
MPRRTALVVPVLEAEAVVGALRLRYDRSAARGVPAHITILFPFLSDEELDEAALEGTFASHRAFDFELARVDHFGDDVTYLAPVPDTPFRALTEAVWRRWPSHPPYGGDHLDPVPHLTVAETKLEVPDVEAVLPIAARAREVLLLVETEPDGGWVVLRRYPLGSYPVNVA